LRLLLPLRRRAWPRGCTLKDQASGLVSVAQLTVTATTFPGSLVCASSPNGSESIPGQCSGSAALSPPQASPSDDREEHEMSGCRPATGSGQLSQRAAERLGRSAGKPEMF